MKYVTGKNITTFLFTCLFLVGCKEPEMEMSPLGKKLPAPALKGTNPFQQDFDNQNYARIQGSCDPRVGTILVSFDKSVWHQPPTSPDLTDTALTPGLTNDTDCADGLFDIYLTKNDLLNLWGISSGSNDVDAIYIKGLSVIGDTETLALIDTSPGNGGGSGGGSTVATTLNLEKNWPRGYAGANQCGSFFVYLSNASGYRASHSADVTFKIKQSAAGNTATPIMAYSNWVDCHNSINSTDTFKIATGDDYTEVIYRFPNAPIDGLLTFSLSDLSTLTANPVAANVVLRSAEYSSTYRWLSLEQTSFQLYKNICYPIRIRSQMYNNSPANDQFGGTLNLTTTDARLKFYSDQSCSTPATEFTFASYDPVLTGYMKFVPSGSSTDYFASFQVTASGVPANSYTYDAQPWDFHADISDNNTVTKLHFQGPRDLNNGDCSFYQVTTTNTNGSVLPVAADLYVNLATLESGLGQFYSDEGCYSPVSTTKILKDKSSATVYFRPTAPTAGTYQFNISASGLTSAKPVVEIHSIARQFKVAPMDLTAGTCKPISVGLADGAGIFKTATSTVTTSLQVYLTPGGAATIYTDPSCSTAVVGGSVPLTINQGESIATVYIQTVGLAGTEFSIYVNSITGYSGTDYSGLFK